MKKFLKVLGITAAVAALAPYRIGRDEETGEKKVEALLWRATATPGGGDERMSVDVSFGFQSPFAPKSGEPLFDEEPVAEFEVPAEDQIPAEPAGEEDAAESQTAETESQAAETEKAQDTEHTGNM